MPQVPGYLWPEPGCYLDGGTLRVQQARWRQRTTFLSLDEPAKWMVVVYVNDVIRYGAVPNTTAAVSTSYTNEMPLSQKSVAVDLSSYGVDASHPLSPTVKVEQYAATFWGAGTWQWRGTNWETATVPLRIYIDSHAGVPKGTTRVWESEALAGNSWNPLSRGFYDEGCKYPADFSYAVGDNSIPPMGAPNGSAGMQFQLVVPRIRIEGVQIWTPPSVLEGLTEPLLMVVRLWEGPFGSAPAKIARQDTVEMLPNWTNFFWTEGYLPAEANLIPAATSPGNPYPYATNPVHDGWYTIGFQTHAGAYYSNSPEAAYKNIYPEHQKVYMHDNYPAGTHGLNRFGPADQKTGDWAPNFNASAYLFCGPILTYIPIYPLPLFNQQIYRRVGAAQ